MQRVVTIRASQKDLDYVLARFTRRNWRVISVTKGSELGRIGFSYKWTVILDGDKNGVNASSDIDDIIKETNKSSYIKTAILVVGLLIGVGALVGVFFALSASIGL